MGIKLGFIGGGNMAEAIIRGAVIKEIVQREDVYVYDIALAKMGYLREQIGINACIDANELVNMCDMTVLCVKPNVIGSVLGGISVKNKPIISIAGGVSIADLRKNAPSGTRILRTMPNTPLMVAQGATVFALPTDFTEQELAFAEQLFSRLGSVDKVPEAYIEQVTAISGCGPAYVYMFIESLADAGVKHGLTRDLATKLATQTVLGSAKMVELSGKHPAQLKSDVCSPGGITVQATCALEEKGFRHSLISAVDAAVDKARNM